MVCEVRRCCPVKSRCPLPGDQEERVGVARGRRLLFHRPSGSVRVGPSPRVTFLRPVEDRKRELEARLPCVLRPASLVPKQQPYALEVALAFHLGRWDRVG